MAFDSKGSSPTHFDTLIVGAGISGIDAAYRLQEAFPDRRYAILEARDAIGGTWDLFRYPGIRSDSDMTTLGFPFEPWDNDVRIAEGPAIRAYVQRTAKKYGIDTKIRFGHKVTAANWDSKAARWSVSVATAQGAQTLTCNFLYGCTGYYDYAAGFTPDYPQREAFQGRFVHPQQWPEDLPLAGKRVLVIGSGATAITLIPSLIQRGAKVTMLQRTPTYIITLPRLDAIAGFLQRVLPLKAAGWLTRWKNILLAMYFYQVSRRKPEAAKKMMLHLARKQLGDSVDMKHFTPPYQPWDQRVCVVPNGDLFRALRKGQAQVVTDRIERFTAGGVLTQSGRELPADIVVSATGLVVQLFGGAQMSIDGTPVNTAERMIYKGALMDGVPNFAFAFGYTNASWTLKCDLSARYVCRVLKHMERKGLDVCVPVRGADVRQDTMVDLQSGYIQRAKHVMPQQGLKKPWRVHQNYVLDMLDLRWSKLEDGSLRFERSAAGAGAAATARN